MSALAELIVRFNRGVDEDAARGFVEAGGATVRRRMRGDRPDEVTLLLRVAVDDAAGLRATLDADSRVAHVEANPGGFSAS